MFWTSTRQHVPQFCSSLLSPQSLSPSHRQNLSLQYVPQFCSSLLSPQSLSPSHRQNLSLQYVPQFCSSLLSPQSLSPSHRQNLSLQYVPQFCSSLLSPQSLSPSHRQNFITQRSFAHRNSFGSHASRSEKRNKRQIHNGKNLVEERYMYIHVKETKYTTLMQWRNEIQQAAFLCDQLHLFHNKNKKVYFKL